MEAQDIGLDDKPLESFIPIIESLVMSGGEEGVGRDRPAERHGKDRRCCLGERQLQKRH